MVGVRVSQRRDDQWDAGAEGWGEGVEDGASVLDAGCGMLDGDGSDASAKGFVGCLLQQTRDRRRMNPRMSANAAENTQKM